MLPTFDLNDTKLVNLLCKKKKSTKRLTKSHQNDASVTTRNKICIACMKISNKVNKSCASKICEILIHEKCLGLRLSEIRDIKNSKTEKHWERQTWFFKDFL